MSRVPEGFPLTSHQRRQAEELAKELYEAVCHGKSALALKAPRTGPLAAIKMPRWPNARAVLGNRGAGKTALVLAALDCLEGLPAKDPDANRPRLRVVGPIDLSLAPLDFPESVVVLNRLRAVLDHHGGEGTLTDECREAFQRVITAGFRGVEGFEQMLREIAVGPEHYLDTAAAQLDERLRMPELLATWLDKEAERAGVDAFVVAVDDVDFAPGDHDPLVWSLVDELHQPRLVFLLVGQLDRIEARLEARAPAVASEVLLKVLPPMARVELDAWPPPDRRSFRRPGRAESLEVVLRRCALSPWLHEATLDLLPGLPRGLEAVYDLAMKRGGAGDAAWLRDLWQLAHARGEHQMADRLRGSAPTLLGEELDFPAARRRRPPVHELEAGSRVGSWAQAATDGLPLYETGDDIGPWQFLLLDAALAGGRIDLPELLDAVPFAAQALRSAERRLELYRSSVRDQLERATEGGRAAAMAAAWAWIRLEADDKALDGFRLSFGPRSALDAATLGGGVFPEAALWSEFSFDPSELLRALGDEAAAYSAGSTPFSTCPIPARARLGLLVALELARAEPRWFAPERAPIDLVELARRAAALHLASLARLAVRAHDSVAGVASIGWVTSLATASGRFLRPRDAPGAPEQAEEGEALRTLRLFLDPPTLDTPTPLPAVGRPIVLQPSEWGALHATIEGLKKSPAVRHLAEG